MILAVILSFAYFYPLWTGQPNPSTDFFQHLGCPAGTEASRPAGDLTGGVLGAGACGRGRPGRPGTPGLALVERFAAGLLVGVVASSLLGRSLWWGVGVAALGAPALLLLVRDWPEGIDMVGRPAARGRPGGWLGSGGPSGSRVGLEVALVVGVALYFVFTRAFTESSGSITSPSSPPSR